MLSLCCKVTLNHEEVEKYSKRITKIKFYK